MEKAAGALLLMAKPIISAHTVSASAKVVHVRGRHDAEPVLGSTIDTQSTGRKSMQFTSSNEAHRERERRNEFGAVA